MSNIDLGGSSPIQQADQIKERMIYLNIPTALMIILDCSEYPKAKKYTTAMLQSLNATLSRVDLRKEILRTCGVKSSGKLKKLNRDMYDKFSKLFGKGIWG